MWWIGVITIIVEIIKLLLQLRKNNKSPALNAEFDAIKLRYKMNRDRRPLLAFLEKLRAECDDLG